MPLRTALAILAGMGLLLGAQGVVGWIMVASGLEPGMTAVEPVRLALHLTLAALFFAALVALYVRLGGAEPEAASPGERFAARALVVLAFVQIALGGLVAGHDAGLTYNTWPLMDGRLVPDGLGMLEPLWLQPLRQHHHHPVQPPDRRLCAGRGDPRLRRRDAAGGPRRRAIARCCLSALVLAQIGVGIATLVDVVPIGLALMHQAIALILLLVLVWNAQRLAPRRV